MSEFLPEVDPDPLPLYLVNNETGLRYEGYLLSDDLREREQRYLEKIAVKDLTEVAERILALHETTGDFDDIKLEREQGDLLLRRRVVASYWPDGRTKTGYLYFFVDTRKDQSYERSWSEGGDSVSWPHDQLEYESAIDVAQYIDDAFSAMAESAPRKRRAFGASILQHFRLQ